MKNNQKYLVRDGKIVTREYFFKKKEEFHKQQAKLPIEEKIRILVELQKIASNIPGPHRKNSIVWDI